MIKKNKYGVYENMELGKEMMEDILKKSATRYLSYKEELGRLELQMLSNIEVVQPGETGLDGQEWNPPVEDRDGNPIMQQFGPNKGEPMEPWPKVEVKCKVLSCSGDKSLEDGAEKYFRIGGINSGLLKTFVKVIKNEGLEPKDFVGTKWSVYGEKENYWKYQVEYLGKGDIKEEPKAESKKQSNIDQTILDAIAFEKDQSKGEIPKTDFIARLAFVTKKKAKDIEGMWDDLISNNLIEDKNGKVKIK